MMAFFFVSGNGSTREEVTRIRSLVRSQVKLINKRKKEKLRLVKKNVVWGKFLNNKNNFLVRYHKAENKMIQRLTKREREIQKERRSCVQTWKRIWIYT